MQVSDIMTNRVISVVPDEAIDAAIELMLKHHISGLPVIGDKGELVGIKFCGRAAAPRSKKYLLFIWQLIEGIAK